MAETLTIRTAASTEVVKIAVQGPQGPKGDKGDPGDVAGLPLSAQGDTLYRGASQNERLAIGTTGQVLKVSAQGLPSWANESGAVTSVNGQTGAVTVAAVSHSHQPNAIFCDAADVADTTLSSGEPNGIYFRDGSDNGKAIYKSAQGYSIWWDDGEEEWVLGNVPQTAKYYIGTGDTTYPWEATSWALGPQGSGDTPVVDQALLSNVQRNAAQDVVSTRTPKSGNASSTQIVLGNDSRLSDSRNATAHAASHASAGSDPLAPSDIGAQSIFSVESLVITTTAQVTLTAARAKIYDIVQYAGAAVDVKLPSTNAIQGDVVVLRWGTGSNTVNVVQSNSPAVITTVSSGEQKRFIRGSTDSWSLVPVDTHTHNASAITSGTLDIARIPTGSTSTTVALGNHSHELTALAATGATNGHVLTANGSNGVTFAALPASGVTGAASSASDVLGVSGANITGVDANADRIVYWNNTSNKLAYGTPADAGAAAASHTHPSTDITGLGTLATQSGTFSGTSSGTNTGDQTITLTGDVTGSGTGSFAATIANDAVTYAKLQNISATSRILGRKTAAAGDTEECTLSEILDFVGSAAQGDILYRGASSWTRLAAGTSGHYLKTNGSAANPEWAAVSGGGSSGSKTYAVFTAEHNQPPSTAFATLDTRNSIAVLDFDAATDENAVFVGIMPEAASLGSGLIVRLHWMATSATSGNVRWGVQFERSNSDLDSDSFDTAVEATAATNGTSGIITTTAITVTTIDGITAGDVFRLKVFRNADDATNDTMTGDAELVAVEIRSAA